MKKGYEARPEVRRMAEELLKKGYLPARVRAAVLRAFGESVSTATVKRWRSQLGKRPPQPFSLADLGLAMQLREQEISDLYALGVQGLTELTTRYPGLDPEVYAKATTIYFLGKTCRWPDVVELAHEFCHVRKFGTIGAAPLPAIFPPEHTMTASKAADATDAGRYWRITVRLKEGVVLNPQAAQDAGTLRQIVLDHPKFRMSLPAGGVDALYIAKPIVGALSVGSDTFYPPDIQTYYYNIRAYPGVDDGWYSLTAEMDTQGNLRAVNGDRYMGNTTPPQDKEE